MGRARPTRPFPCRECRAGAARGRAGSSSSKIVDLAVLAQAIEFEVAELVEPLLGEFAQSLVAPGRGGRRKRSLQDCRDRSCSDRWRLEARCARCSSRPDRATRLTTRAAGAAQASSSGARGEANAVAERRSTRRSQEISPRCRADGERRNHAAGAGRRRRPCRDWRRERRRDRSLCWP